MKKLIVLAMAFAVLLTALAPAQAAPLPHPRIWINSAILTRMQTARTNNTAEWQALQSYCDNTLGDNIPSGYQFLDWYAAVMNYGLAYRVSGNASYGSEGVKYLTALLRDRNTIGDGAGGAGAISVDSGYVARDLGVGVAIGRDWLDGASGMTTSLINECNSRLNDWITWYNSNGYARTDPTDNYYAGYFTMVYTASIALEGDSGYQSSWQTQAENMWSTQVLPFMQTGAGAGGNWLQGWNYGPWSVREYLGYPYALETGTTRDNHWDETTWATDLVMDQIHMLYPYRGFIDDAGCWSGNFKGDPRRSVCQMCTVMSPNSATIKGLAKWFTTHLTWEPGGTGMLQWEALMYTDPAVTEVAPTVSNMGGLKYLVYGHGVARSADWTNLNATWVGVEGEPIDGQGESGLHTGEVKIGSRGHILLIDGRTYEYTSDLASVPDITGSHLYAPLQGWWHDAVTYNMDNVDSAYAYFKVDNMQGCYGNNDGTLPDVSYMRRDTAFLRPDFVAVLDTVTTVSTSNAITEKWYTAGQPTINGATASITLGGAKLFTNTVNPTVSVTSAANSGSRTPGYDPNEGFSGVYKVLISPSSPSTSNSILQLFETADSTQGSMTAYDKLTPTGFLGVSIKHATNPRLVLFATGQSPHATSCSFAFTPVASPTKVLLTGMQASTSFSVTVTDGGGGSKNVTVATGSGYTSTANGALSFDVVSGPAPLQITTTSLPADTINIAYNQTLTATGGTSPYTWAISSGSLPTGLSLVASTGAITGTATAAGTSSFTARVTDNVSATATQALSIVINPAPGITTSSLANGQVGVSYNQSMAATGGTTPYSWSIPAGSLPAGLSLGASSGAITGTPTASGTSNFTATVTDSVGATGTKALSIVINNGPPVITTASLPGDTINVAYNQTLTATGGQTPYTWSISSGSLPTGLSLNSSTGAITGTPTATGTSGFTARVADNAAATATKALSIVVNPAPSIATATLPGGQVGVAYSQTLSATGGTTPLTWSISSGSLPTGLSLVASTGAITGTPTASGTSNFTARVTDNVGATATQALSIAVTQPPQDPTYQQAASDTETSTASTAWQNKTTLTFTPTVSDTWLILAFGEYRGSSSSYEARVRLTVDGTEEGLGNMMPENGNEYYSFGVSKVATLSAASHTLNIDYCTSNAAQSTYLRRARIVAIRKATLEMHSAAADATVNLTTTPTDFAPVTFTPATAGDYLLVFSVESMGQYSDRAIIRPTLNSTIIDEGDIAARADVNFDNFASFCVATLPASSQTVKITAYADSARIFNTRRFRVTVIRLTGGRFADYASIADDTQSNTTSTTFVQKLTKTWTSGSTGNWLLLSSARLQGAGGQTGEVQVNYNTSTTLAQPLRTFQASNEWRNEDCVAVQNIVAGGRQMDTNYRSSSASYTVSIKYAHEVMLPLDSGGTALSIITTSLPADTVNVAYNQTLAATGGATPYTWSIQSGSLPAGLSLVASTGAITGTPATAGTSGFTAKVTDNVSATATQALSIAINQAVSITTSSLPADTVGVAYNQTLAATGGTGVLTWSVSSGSLPAGLSLAAATGAITGTPTTAATSSFTVTATDTVSATGTRALSIVINAAISITTSSLPNGQIGVAYSQTLAATGGTTPLTWAIASGTLPAGLSLASGGTISGTPTASGTSSFTVRAVDAVSATATKALSVAIPADLSITTSSLPAGTLSAAYSQTLAASGGVTPYAWSLASGSLPNGLSLTSGGVISGTPTAAGTSSFTVRVTDAQTPADSATKALSIVVNSGSEPTYQFAASDTETSTTSTAFQTKTTLTFTPTAADTWVILAFAEFKGSSASYQVKAEVAVDGTTEADIIVRPKQTTDYQSFGTSKVATLSAASHTINLTYCSSSASATAYIRNARVVAIKKASLEAWSGASDSTTALTTTMTNYATATFTPATAGDYLLVFSAELYGNTTSYSTEVQAMVGSTVLDDCFVESNYASNYWPFASFTVANLPASAQTVAVAAAKESGSSATHNIRRARVVAIRLAESRFAGYQTAVSDAESTTTSTAFVEKMTKSWSVSTAGNWLVLSSFGLANSSANRNVEARAQLDNTTAEAQPLRRPQDTTDYMNGNCVDVRNLATGTRQVDVDFRSSASSGTAKIKYAHLVALPL